MLDDVPKATLDTHFHLDLCSDPAAMVRRIEASRVYTIAVTNAPAVFPQTERLVRGAKYIRAAVGLHPELAIERRSELPLFRRYLSRTKFVGEIGLDYVTTVESDRRTQRRVFDAILADCRMARGKILTIHSRRAAVDVVEAMGDAFPGVWILHWYSGSRSVLHRALAQGAFFSVNSAMILSDRSESLIRELPPDRVLTESDGPFIAIDGAPATPVSLGGVVQRLSEWWGVDTLEARTRLRENARQILAKDWSI
jgi:TatD DNase family protein